MYYTEHIETAIIEYFLLNVPIRGLLADMELLFDEVGQEHKTQDG